MFNKFVLEKGVKLINTVFEDYLGTQFFPPLKFAIDKFDNSKIGNIYSKIGKNNNLKSLYIHIPFCKTKCIYCHCYTSLKGKENYKEYIKYLLKEIEQVVNSIGEKISLDSIFIGGGTPNIIGNKLLEKLLISINSNFDLNNISQFNIDLNPYFLDYNTIDILSKYKVNRCTYAIQSFNEDVLKQNSRFYKENINHKKNVFYLRKKGILVNIDLMIGIKGQTIETCISDIKYAKKINVDNISLNYFIQSYNVNYKIDKEKMNLINKIKKYYNHSIYNTYNKNANFQEENYLSNKVDLIGLGVGSITHLYGNIICYNIGNIKNYYEDIDNKNGKNKKIKYLTIKDEIIKFIWLNLIYGINKKETKKIFKVNILEIFKEEFNYLEKQEIIEIIGDYIRPKVSNLKLYLYLSIFLKQYIGGIELNNNLLYIKENIKRFFLSNGEKVDEDY